MTGKGIVVGLMSGTSADGVDACAARLGIGKEDGRPSLNYEILHYETISYASELRKAILKAATVEDVCRLNFAVAEAFAEAADSCIRAAGLDKADVLAISSHGQTLHHAPEAAPIGGYASRSTLQVGDISVIAARTGVKTVGDFRTKDLALGGQGAPLVPFVDYLLTGAEAVVWLNIGGIANITVVPAGAGLDEVVAFDTGPGNCLLDRYIRLRTDGVETHDVGGRLALAGKVDEGALNEMLRRPYFAAEPPKSTGPEEFGDAFLSKYCLPERTEDALATFCQLTAETIAGAIEKTCGEKGAARVIASGGGIHNGCVMKRLAERLSPTEVVDSSAVGIPPDAKEAFAFAVLGIATLSGIPNNVPPATGASRPAVLGKVALPE